MNDRIIFDYIFSLANKSHFLDQLIVLFAAQWEYVVTFAVLAYLLRPKKTLEDKKNTAKVTGLAIISAIIARLGFVELIRLFWIKDRPFVLEGITPLFDHAASPAFPSGHATFFMALAIYFLLAGHKKFGWFLTVSALLISLGRVAAGVHWPLDILAGWVVGGLTSYILWLFVSRREAKKETAVDVQN